MGKTRNSVEGQERESKKWEKEGENKYREIRRFFQKETEDKELTDWGGVGNEEQGFFTKDWPIYQGI